jgi:hypothetical protein
MDEAFAVDGWEGTFNVHHKSSGNAVLLPSWFVLGCSSCDVWPVRVITVLGGEDAGRGEKACRDWGGRMGGNWWAVLSWR